MVTGGRVVKIAFATKVSVVISKTWGRGWWEKCQWCFLCDSLSQISHVQKQDTCLKGHKPQAQNFTFCAHLGFFPEGDLAPWLHHHLQHEDPWGKIWHKEKYHKVITTQVLRRWAHSPTTCYSTEQSLNRKEKAQGINSLIITPLPIPTPVRKTEFVLEMLKGKKKTWLT